MYGNYRNNNTTDDRGSRNTLNQDIPGICVGFVFFVFFSKLECELFVEYGSAFVCGKSRFEAEKFHVKNDPIISISCGDEHTGVVTGNLLL